MENPNPKSDFPLWAKIAGVLFLAPPALIVLGVMVLAVQTVWSAVLR